LPSEWFASSPAIFNTVEESLQGWTLLYEALAGKPSGGGPNSPVTDEDRQYAAAGDFHEFPPGTPPVKYLRIHFKENWSGGILAQIRQIRFSGIYVE
jgi:hypothetical protein